MKNIYYGEATASQRDFIENCIKRDIRANQFSLVDKLLSDEIFDYIDIRNSHSTKCPNCDIEFNGIYTKCQECNYDRYNNPQDMKKIFEWYLLDDEWIKYELIKLGEPVLSNEYGDWWGRTVNTQSIALDLTFWEIYQDVIVSIS